MKIYLASDHAGFDLKQHLVAYLEENGFEVADSGPKEKVAGDDYPDWIGRAAKEVSENPTDAKGIVIGLSGQGEAIVANKFKNVRAIVYYGPAYAKATTGKDLQDDFEIVRLSREHNDANVLSLGAKFVTPQEAEKVVDLWLETQFSNDPRHKRRIDKISALESKI